MLEAIKRLKEELISRHVNDHGLATGEGMRWLRNCQLTPDEVLSIIDRAIRIASEHHLAALEMTSCCDDGGQNGDCDCQNINIDASRQAHEELTGEVKTE